MWIRLWRLWSVFTLSLLAGSPATAQVTFFPLGDLDGEEFRSGAFAVSGDATTAVGVGTSTASGSNGREALKWDASAGSIALGSLPGGNFWSIAHGINRAGDVIVGESSSANSGANSTEAARWVKEEVSEEAYQWTLTGLGDLSGGSFRGIAYDQSEDGSTIVGASSSAASGSNAEEAFLWREADGMMEALGSLAGGAFSSAAFGISDDSSIVVGGSSSAMSGSNLTEAFRWVQDLDEIDPPFMEGLGSLDGGSFNSVANAVSGDGSVIAGGSSSAASGSNSLEAFRWTEAGGLEALGALPGGTYSSEALAISYQGDVIVGTSTTGQGDDAFIWDAENGMRRLFDVIELGGVDLSTWRLTRATGVSDDGTLVVGTGLNPIGNDEGWVVRLPEPATSLQQAAALLILAGLCRRRSSPRSRGEESAHSPSLMLRGLAGCLVVLLVSPALSCATKTRISSQWLSPDYTGGPMHKILVVAVSETPQGRRSYEDRFSDALANSGAEPVSSYKLLPSDDRLTKPEIEEIVRRHRFDGVIVSRLLEVAEKTTHVPPSSHVVPSYGYGYYGYYGMGYDVVHSPGYTRTTEIVRLETNLWNAVDSQLAWGITSETFDPTSTDDAISSITKKLAKKLAEDGLIAN